MKLSCLRINRSDLLEERSCAKVKLKMQGRLTNSKHFDREIQPNILTGHVATNEELNTGLVGLNINSLSGNDDTSFSSLNLPITATVS